MEKYDIDNVYHGVMPVVNTACPRCGEETIVNLPDGDTKVAKVASANGNRFKYYDSKAGCSECGRTFYVGYG
jgi:hypothetical protein